MTCIFEAIDQETGSTARVFQEGETFTVKYFDSFDTHMDADDFTCEDRDYAIMMATPEDEEFLDHYEAYYGRNI